MGIINHITVLINYRYLLVMWTVREVRLRYKQAILGASWAILQPLALTVVFTIFFSIIARLPSDGLPYPLFAFTGLLPWTFIANSLSFGTTSLINNMSLVTKVNIPREVLPMASVGASLVDFTAALVVFLGLLLYYHVNFTLALLWIPYLVIIQVILAVGIVLFSSAMIVFFRDLRFAIPLFIQLWLYASPVIYPASMIPEPYRAIYMLNPVAGLIESYRLIFLHGQSPTTLQLMPMTIISIMILITGFIFFKKNDWKFADAI